MKYAVRTEVGKRAHNEDSYRIPREGETCPALIAVADGMGGHAAGDLASGLLVASLDESAPEIASALCGEKAMPAAELLIQAIDRANMAIFSAAERDRTKRGMGSTLVAALFTDEAHFLAANVGDSRMYLYHAAEERLEQVTLDHSLVEQLVRDGILTPEEARVHPQRNIITRAMGVSRMVQADLFEREWQKGDVLLLCSDGLHGPVGDELLQEALAASVDLDETCEVLVQAALDIGGTDNITLILAVNDNGGNEGVC